MSLFFRRREGGETRAMDWWGHDAMPPGSNQISATQATHLVPVFAVLRHMVDYVATLPLQTYRQGSNGSNVQVPTLPALFRNADAMGRPGLQQFIGQAVYGLAAYGNAVGWISETDGYGYPTVIRWLKHLDWSFNNADQQWYVGGVPVASSRIFHIPWIVPTGWTLGLAPFDHYSTMIRAGLSAQEYADVRRGGGLPPSWLQNKRLPTLGGKDRDEASRIREVAVEAFRSGKPFVTGSDWQFNAIAIPPNHQQFIETLRLTADQVGAIYGVDAREIGGQATESLTYSTDESKTLNRASNMRPYIERLEDAFSRVLPERQRIEFCIDATIRSDIATRVTTIGQKVADGRLSVNEARALDNLPPVDGGDYHNINKTPQQQPPPPRPQGSEQKT